MAGYNSVCYNCKRRTIGCHIDCSFYKAFVEENQRIKEKKRKDQNYTVDRDAKSYRHRSLSGRCHKK